MEHPKTNAHGFTLIEVVVVVAILALLLSILLPSLGRARETTRSVLCLNNLRQMAIAAHGYASTYRRFPPYLFSSPDGKTSYGWDLQVRYKWENGKRQAVVKPGLLWQGTTIEQINQCPKYEGSDNWVEYPYTGYNYNSSYVGYCEYYTEVSGWPPAPTGQLVVKENPARPEEIRQAAGCVLFGDGEFVAGANKFMRSPFKGRDGSFSGRSAGTQGYRHLKRTNVAFADGHAESWSKRFTDTYDFDEPNIQPHGDIPTGFLSANNDLYDLN